MPPFLRLLRRARILLVFAALLLIAAQLLPWERVPVMKGGIEFIEPPLSLGPFGTASSNFSAIHQAWHFEHPSSSTFYGAPGTSITLSEPVTITRTTINNASFPQEVESYQAIDLGLFAQALTKAGSIRLWCNSGTLYLFLHLLTIIGALAVPFLAASLARARPLLWLTRFSACSVLACLIGILILNHQEVARSLHIIGSGYWLTMTALLVEITALFLIPNAAKDRSAQSA